MRFSLGEFILDTDTRQLLRGAEEVHLSPKALDLLKSLLDLRPKAISKRDLQDALWPGTFVSESNLPTLIAEVRTALGDDPHTPRFVRTVNRFGYAFCGETDATADAESAGADSGPGYWLTWGRRTFPLAAGENILGRDRLCAVWLPLPGVSRRHARIVVGDGGATAEDLGSKNGTLVRGELIAAPFPLNDGDSLRLGSATVTFRISSGGPTETESVT